ncbi:MAG: pseudaminic acid synthase [Lachnospiraceae bacterium]|nr:pseudaminic acid synthase [Lachnospiraceae bacterium]
MNKSCTIGKKLIAPDAPVYIIAEMSGNHNGEFHRAMRIIEAAADAGADAVKLQTYTADTITLDCNTPDFRIDYGSLWDGRTLHDLYREAATPWEWQPRLALRARELGMDCFSSPFDFSAVDFLEDMNVPAYKIASFEITDIPLLRKVAQTGKPVIISTGIAHREEIEEAVRTCRDAGNGQIILLKCCSAYPAPYEDMNLRTIPKLAEDFGCLVGLSDHTPGHTVPVASVALGACVVEKHLTLSRADGGVDSAFSMEPAEFKEMVTAIRDTEKSLGRATYDLSTKQEESRWLMRSLYIAQDLQPGDILTPENLRSVRPGHGMHTRHYDEMLGKKVNRVLRAGTPMAAEFVEDDLTPEADA